MKFNTQINNNISTEKLGLSRVASVFAAAFAVIKPVCQPNESIVSIVNSRTHSQFIDHRSGVSNT